MRLPSILIPLLLAGAAASAARLETSVNPREVRVGDRLTLTVVFVPGPGEKPLPFESPSFGPFEPAGPIVSSTTAEGTSVEIPLATFELDRATIPALTFRYLDAKGRARSLDTPEIPVPVKSVLPPGAKDLKCLKGKPAPLPFDPRPWLIALAAAVLGAAGFWLFSRRRRAAEIAAGPPPLPPDEEALRALEALAALLDGPAKPYYSALTDLFRRYIERRFGLPATDRTTTEMIPLLKELPVPSAERSALRELLETADLAKFARFESPAEERARHRTQVRAFVEETRPRPAEEAPK
jgi:hypothetical protein